MVAETVVFELHRKIRCFIAMGNFVVPWSWKNQCTMVVDIIIAHGMELCSCPWSWKYAYFHQRAQIQFPMIVDNFILPCSW